MMMDSMKNELMYQLDVLKTDMDTTLNNTVLQRMDKAEHSIAQLSGRCSTGDIASLAPHTQQHPDGTPPMHMTTHNPYSFSGPNNSGFYNPKPLFSPSGHNPFGFNASQHTQKFPELGSSLQAGYPQKFDPDTITNTTPQII